MHGTWKCRIFLLTDQPFCNFGLRWRYGIMYSFICLYCFSLSLQNFLLFSRHKLPHMGNTESSPDDAYESSSRQPASAYGGYPVETGYRPQSPEHATSSTQTNNQHHTHTSSHARTSMSTNYRKKQHSAYIADKFNSLDEVSFPLTVVLLLWLNVCLVDTFTKLVLTSINLTEHRNSVVIPFAFSFFSTIVVLNYENRSSIYDWV